MYEYRASYIECGSHTNIVCFEAPNCSHRDVMGGVDNPFGGLIIVFDGDFRYILLVVPKASRHDIVNAYL